MSFKKILIITKSLPLQNELRNILGNNYILLFVSDSDRAIDLLQTEQNITTVLVGIFLKETKGFEFLEYLKKHRNFYTGPVLAIVDTITDDVINLAEQYNIFDFIVRYSNDNIIKTRIRNAVIYYTEKNNLLSYAVEKVYDNLADMRILITLLAHIIEAKNDESGKHIEQVNIITRILAKRLLDHYNKKYNITERDIEYIALASALHDIGKIYIPDDILNKPGKLTDEEFNIMKTHAMLGAAEIEKIAKYESRPIIQYARDICLSHHERWDGGGYPNHLRGNEIPIWAQIVSVADCYDALTNNRVYRKSFSHEIAIEMIASGECGIFNPDLIKCLLEASTEIKTAKANKIFNKLTKDSILNIITEICEVK